MVLLYVLLGSFVLFRAIGFAGMAAFASWQPAVRAALFVMFLLTASAHFGRGRGDLIRMVPSAFPRPDLLVTITGILEVLGALGLLLTTTRSLASVCLALMLVAMFPANIRAARERLTIRGREATRLPWRIALQAIFIGAILAAGWM
jgi:uncharacterized membrane protein